MGWIAGQAVQQAITEITQWAAGYRDREGQHNEAEPALNATCHCPKPLGVQDCVPGTMLDPLAVRVKRLRRP